MAIELTWSTYPDNADLERIKIHRDTDPFVASFENYLDEVDGSATSYVDSTADRPYYYSLVAVNKFGFNVTLGSFKVEAPLCKFNIESMLISWSWASIDSDVSIQKTEIHRGGSEFTPSSSTLIETINDSSITEYQDTSSLGTSYYVIIAFDTKGNQYEVFADYVTSIKCNRVAANMFVDDVAALNYQANVDQSQLTTMKSIFQTWPRVTDRTWYSSPATVPSGDPSNVWTYDETKESFVYQENNAITTLIVSPDKAEDLTITGTLTSDSSDNDAIGIVVAADRYFDSVRYLTMWVDITTQDSGISETLSLRYGDDNNGGSGDVEGIGDLIDGNSDIIPQSTSGWGGKKVDFEINKINDVITAKVSNMYSGTSGTGTIGPDSSAVTCDLANLPSGSILTGSARYGFGVNSQQDTFYENISFVSSNLQSDEIAYAAQEDKKYVFKTTGWEQSGIATDDFPPSVDLIENLDTGELFYNGPNGIQEVLE